jgi:hypothetical protein
MDDLGNCSQCKRPLVEIDHYGELLVGCVDCNRWRHPGDKKFMMALLEDDLDELRARMRRRYPPH